MMQPLQFCLQHLLGETVQILLLLVGLGTSICCSKARDLNEEELRYALGIDEKGERQEVRQEVRRTGRMKGNKNPKEIPKEVKRRKISSDEAKVQQIPTALDDMPCTSQSNSAEKVPFISAKKGEDQRRKQPVYKRSGIQPYENVPVSSQDGRLKGSEEGNDDRNDKGKDTDDSYFRADPAEAPYENMGEDVNPNGSGERFGKEYDYHANQGSHTKELFETIGPPAGDPGDGRINSDEEMIGPKRGECAATPGLTLFDNAENKRGKNRKKLQGKEKGQKKKKKKGKEHGHRKKR